MNAPADSRKATPQVFSGNRPRHLCPICGSALLRSTLFGHVGSERCLKRMHELHDGHPQDPIHGQQVLDTLRKLNELLAHAPRA